MRERHKHNRFTPQRKALTHTNTQTTRDKRQLRQTPLTGPQTHNHTNTQKHTQTNTQTDKHTYINNQTQMAAETDAFNHTTKTHTHTNTHKHTRNV